MSKKIINDIKLKQKLPIDIKISADTIRNRVDRKSTLMTGIGVKPPLFELEPMIVSIVIQMARIRQCLTPSRGI